MVSIYGGRPYEPQIEALRAGADVVVGTPGRLLDLAQQGHLQLGGLSVLVLDEADEMLDLGFLPDIERILRQIPDVRQSMLFSATMPDPIITLARTFMNQPTHIRAEAPHSSAVHDATKQYVYRAHALDKVELVSRILQARGRGATMIFTRTKRTAQKVADELAERGFAVGAVHGDLGQIAREKALKAFRTGGIDVLVATDVAARGIDVDDVTHVINYQIPEDEQAYVHRIGRTGRAGKTGVAVTLVDWDELARWTMIDKALGLGCPDPAETYSNSPHLYVELDIPTETKAPSGHRANRRPNAPRRVGATATNPGNSATATGSGGAPAAAKRRRATPLPALTASPKHGVDALYRYRERNVRRRRAHATSPSAPAQVSGRGRHRQLNRRRRRPMVKPERRTRADVLAAAAIVAVVAAAAALIWWTSDARATISRPASVPAPSPTPAREVPASLGSSGPPPARRPSSRSLSAGPSSPATGAPSKGAIRSPAQCGGATRATAICAGSPGSTATRSRSIATTGAAVRSARSTDPPAGAGPPEAAMPTSVSSLSSDGTTVLSAGDTRLELWRSDMVRMLSYGEIDARVKPSSKGLHTGCRLTSAAASSAAVSVLEACGRQADLRLTLLRPSKEEDEPDQRDVPGAGDQRGFRRPGPDGGGDPDGGISAGAAAQSRRGRRDRHDRGEHAAAQAAVGVQRGITARQPGHLVDRRHGNGLRCGEPDLPLLHCAAGPVGSGGAGDDDGRQVARPGHRRHRRL